MKDSNVRTYIHTYVHIRDPLLLHTTFDPISSDCTDVHARMQHTDEEENGRRSGARLFSLPDSLAARRPTTLVSELQAPSLSLSLSLVSYNSPSLTVCYFLSHRTATSATRRRVSTLCLFSVRLAFPPTRAMPRDDRRRGEEERESRSAFVRFSRSFVIARKRGGRSSIDPSFAGVPLAFARAKGKV